MRVALLLSGNPRFSVDFDSQLQNLQNAEIDWYVVFWRRERGLDPKISDNWYPQTAAEIRDRITPHIPKWHKIKYIELLDPNLYNVLPRQYEAFNSTPINVWQQYNILNYCDSWRKYLGSYDLVIRSRPDLGLSIPIDLKLAYDSLCKTPNVIYTPNNQRYGYHVNINNYVTGFNDQFAIGLPHVMSIYTDAINHFDRLYSNGVKYNPEYLLQTHLMENGIIWPPTSFEILRDPAHYVPINHGKWAEI